jgi:ubiquinone/menaquinone biosynthesis C-methylase UbiE
MTEASQSYDPNPFKTTVPFYSRYRPPYPQRLIARVVAFLGLKPGDAVMDLGCGPGPLAIAFARLGLKVTGVDPEPAMLEAARDAARAAGVAVELRQGSSFDWPRPIGPFRMVVMGRAFHWMDRKATLQALDPMVTDDGAVVLLDDEYPRTVENRWRKDLTDLADRYGRGELPHIVERRSPDYRSHKSFLLDSAFPLLDGLSVITRRELGADDVVGLAFSLSTCSQARLGDRAAEFEAELRRALAALSPDGRFTEIVEMEALVARRAAD